MMDIREVSRMNFLRERSQAFFRGAKRYFEEKEYALSAFNIEQAVQLALKGFLQSRLGDFAKTHNLKILFEDCSKLCPSLAKVYAGSEILISNIEDAYIMARYFDKEYSASEVKVMLEFYETLVLELNKCE
jgi:HEPN domain-containing protein